jgi:ATP-dependent DNA helicase RecQ
LSGATNAGGDPSAGRGAVLAERAQALLTTLAGAGAVLREDQLAAIRALVSDGRRTVVVKRTGWGKSAVYLLATRLLRDAGAGPTLLVSPLLSLMRDQIAKAEAIGIRAATINSTNLDQWRSIEAELAAGRVDLLLISPERLNNHQFRAEVLPDLSKRVGLLVIDEAHCISDWGHDFRPDYRRLVRVLDDLDPTIPVLACTATANQRVMDDVAEQLGASPLLFRGSLDRESLRLSVLRIPSQADRLAWLAERVPQLPGSGIVYCLTVGDADRVAIWLRANGVEAVAYSGRTDPAERVEIEDALRANRVKVVAATSALGMGFDKPELAFVVHFQSPDSPVTYYQQIGRAGRALDRAEVVLLCGAEDRSIWEWFASTAFPPRDQVATVLGALEAAGGPMSTALLEEVANLSRTRLELMLKVLDVEGAVRRIPRGWERTDAPWTYDAGRHQRVAAARKAEQAAMLAYATTGQCLMAYLRVQLDDPDPGPCGRCANCTGQPPSAEVAPGLAAEAQRFLAGQDLVLSPRLQWPQGIAGRRGKIAEQLRVQPGRALATLGGPGWGPVVRDLLAADGPVSDELVEAVVRVLGRWDWPERPAWVTFVPSRRHPKLVEDLASRIAEVGRLPLRQVLERTRDAPPQLEMANSAHQCRNVHDAFTLTDPVPSGGALLVDDAADSKWTLTVVGALLRQRGAGRVYPLVLLRRGAD